MKFVFSSSKILPFNLHGSRPSSSLQIFLRCCCLIQEKKIVTQPSLIFLNKFPDINIFSAGIKSNNLSYFAPSSSILFSVFSSLCFLHIFSLFLTPQSIASILLIVTNPEKTNRFDLLNLFKKMSPELQLSAQSVRIRIDKSKYI